MTLSKWRAALCVASIDGLFLSAGCLSAGNALATEPAFQHIIIDPHPSVNGSDTLEKALVDINGDGLLDAVLGEGGGGLYWYEAPASGNLADPWIRHTIAPDGNFYEDIAVADVNGDGAPDLIASDNDQIVWFENPRGHGGNPATDPWPVHMIRASGGAHVIALGDIDGDGKLDVVVSGSDILGSTSAILFQNNPDSWTEVDFGHLGEGVALLDIGSGLGNVDIAGADGDNVVWFENPRESGGDARTGSWIEHVIASLPYAEGDSFASGVFSSSGGMDLIAAANENMPVSGLYRLVAPADRRQPWQVQTIDSTYQAVHKIDVGDMDRDGNLDFVVAEQEQAHNTGSCWCQNFNNQRVAVFYNDGNGNFTQQILATTGGQNQVLGDIDHDGDLDILSANHGYYGAPNPLELWVNQLYHPSATAGGTAAIQDPGFEDSSSLAPAWTVEGNPAAAGIDTSPDHAHSGSNDGFIWDGYQNGAFVDLGQTIPVTPGTDYTLIGWVDANNTMGGFFGVRAGGGATIAAAPLSNTDPGPYTHAAGYRRYSVTFNSGSNSSVTIFIGYTTPGSPSFINVDDISIGSGAAPAE
jgi:hypothetical protein